MRASAAFRRFTFQWRMNINTINWNVWLRKSAMGFDGKQHSQLPPGGDQERLCKGGKMVLAKHVWLTLVSELQETAKMSEVNRRPVRG